MIGCRRTFENVCVRCQRRALENDVKKALIDRISRSKEELRNDECSLAEERLRTAYMLLHTNA